MRSAQTILDELLADARTAASYLNWSPKTPQSDILAAVSSEISRQDVLLDYVKLLTTLDGYVTLDTDTDMRSKLMSVLDISEDELSEMLKADLDEFASIYNKTRKLGFKTLGSINMVFTTFDPVTIAVGQEFTNLTNNKIYVLKDVIQTVTPVLVTSTSVNTITAILEAKEIGSNYNIIAGSYFAPSVAISNFSYATNPVAWGNGEDEETNSAFVERIKESRASSGVGSPSYFTGLMTDDARVFDCWINSKEEQGFERPWGVDLWVYARETPVSVNETVTQSTQVLTTAPLVEDAGVSDVTVVPDTGWFRQSVLAVNTAIGQTVGSVVTYTCDQTIQDLQRKIDDVIQWIIGARSMVLVKKAKRVNVDVTYKAYFLPGYTTSTVKTNIANNLLLFFTGGTTTYGKIFERKLLGEDIDKSDVMNVILDTEGVDRIDIPTFEVVRHDGVYESDPLRIDDFEYASCGVVTAS
jgi:hypothetical protein